MDVSWTLKEGDYFWLPHLLPSDFAQSRSPALQQQRGFVWRTRPTVRRLCFCFVVKATSRRPPPPNIATRPPTRRRQPSTEATAAAEAHSPRDDSRTRQACTSTRWATLLSRCASFWTVVLNRGGGGTPLQRASIDFQGNANPYAICDIESMINKFTDNYICFYNLFKARGWTWNKGQFT